MIVAAATDEEAAIEIEKTTVEIIDKQLLENLNLPTMQCNENIILSFANKDFDLLINRVDRAIKSTT